MSCVIGSYLTPVPKLYPPVQVESDLQPIEVTSVVAKITETFISRYFIMSFFDDYL